MVRCIASNVYPLKDKKQKEVFCEGLRVVLGELCSLQECILSLSLRHLFDANRVTSHR